MTDEQIELLTRVGFHFPDLDLEARVCSWKRTDDGRQALVVDGGSVMFTLAGEDLQVTGPTANDKVACYLVGPDGEPRLGAEQPDPYSAEQAAMN